MKGKSPFQSGLEKDERYRRQIRTCILEPVHFPNQAGTMGVLCNPAHKALADFPTDMHTDWQWWDLNKNSKTMITDSIQEGPLL